MNTKVKIISPKPLRSSVFFVPENKSIRTNNSKFLCSGTIGSNPFKMHSDNMQPENPTQYLDNQPSITDEMCLNTTIKNSISNHSPIAISHIDDDFLDFKASLNMLIEENEAKSEILSILSTDHNDSNLSRINIRSSMPPIRPLNPILRKLEREDSSEIPLSEISVEIPFTKTINSVHEIGIKSK
jgi:hypothetical protein